MAEVTRGCGGAVEGGRGGEGPVEKWDCGGWWKFGHISTTYGIFEDHTSL